MAISKDITIKTIILPMAKEGFEYVLKEIPKTQIELLTEEKDKLQAELDEMETPSDKELIELGKDMHPYYDTEMILEMLNEQILKIK